MSSYETMIILRPDLDEEAKESIIERFKGFMEKNGAEGLSVENWGQRRMAYEIKKYNEGHYYLIRFSGKHQIVPELEYFFRIADEVIRFMIVRVD